MSKVYSRGSPPRVRGKAHVCLMTVISVGITPACAGKSRSVQGPAGSCGDHPRVCGEKELRKVTTLMGMGSPPRVRGKEELLQFVIGHTGITPACAGKSRNPAGL